MRPRWSLRISVCVSWALTRVITSRPMCKYPRYALYTGSSDPKLADSFVGSIHRTVGTAVMGKVRARHARKVEKCVIGVFVMPFYVGSRPAAPIPGNGSAKHSMRSSSSSISPGPHDSAACPMAVDN